MGVQYLIDTNILIYILKQEIPEGKINEIARVIDDSFNISAISKVETLGWKKLTGTDRSIAEDFLQQARVYAISDKIIDLSIKIRQADNIKTPDAIIAATALDNGFSLMTRNDKDFNKVEGLTVYNPFA